MNRIRLIVGEDDFLVSEAAKRFIGETASVEVVDSISSTNADLQMRDLAAVAESVATPPFLDPSKATWWKNVGFLPQGGNKGPSEDVKKALEAFAAKLASSPLPDNQLFVITASKLLATSVFAKTMKTIAEVVVFSEGKPWEKTAAAAARAVDAAAELGLRFEGGAVDAFVARVGSDARSIFSEVAKLRDYIEPGAKTITNADVAAVSSPGVGCEPEIWTVTDALGERSAARALSALAPFERESGFAVLATTVIEKFFRTLAVMKDAQEHGALEDATKGMSPFAARKNTGFLRNWTLTELRRARADFVALRERAVTSTDGMDSLVVAAVARACRRPGEGGRR